MSKLRRAIIVAVLLVLTQPASAGHVLVYGDSLSAAYGLNLEQGWAALLAERMGTQHSISNASVSGETSAGGLARLPVVLEELDPDLVILELGANDGLRGYPVAMLAENLRKMIALSRAAGARVMLVGISLPPSYGPRYIDQFESTFKTVANELNVPLFNFVLEEFFTEPGYIQEDGLHPTAKAQPLIADLMHAFLETEKLIEATGD